MSRDDIALALACLITRTKEDVVKGSTRGNVRAAYARHMYIALLKWGDGLTDRNAGDAAGRRNDTIRKAVTQITDDCAAHEEIDDAMEALSEMADQLSLMTEQLDAMAQAFERDAAQSRAERKRAHANGAGGGED